MNTQDLKLTYEERNALAVIRKALQRKPGLAAALLEGMSKEAASRVLSQGQKELTDMLAVTRAFSAAAAKLVSLDAPN